MQLKNFNSSYNPFVHYNDVDSSVEWNNYVADIVVEIITKRFKLFNNFEL